MALRQVGALYVWKPAHRPVRHLWSTPTKHRCSLNHWRVRKPQALFDFEYLSLTLEPS